MVVVDGFDWMCVLVLVVVVESWLEYLVVEVIVWVVFLESGLLLDVEDFVLIIGYGVSVMVFGNKILVGVDCFMFREGVEIGDLCVCEEDFVKWGCIVLFVVIDGMIVVVFGVFDLVKFLSRQVVVVLKV